MMAEPQVPGCLEAAMVVQVNIQHFFHGLVFKESVG
jgi:hypothetical protein